MSAITLYIANVPVRQDDEGRFFINDFHKASGGAAKHRPNFFLSNQQTKELIAELEKDDAGIPATKTIQGKGKEQGTYVVKELIYAYATWVSARFFLTVIRAYDALVTGQPPATYQLIQNQIDALQQHVHLAIQAIKKHGPYSTDEDEILIAEWCQGNGARKIAKTVNRTFDSVEHRLRWLKARFPERFVRAA